MNCATSSRENNTVLARRAFVQQKRSSSLPIIWNSSTGLPDFREASQAAATLACQRTLPGSTFGLAASVAGAGAERSATTRAVGRSIRTVLVGSVGRGAGGCWASTEEAAQATVDRAASKYEETDMDRLLEDR